MKEQWKQITNFPDYAISNRGRVKRLTDNGKNWKAGRLVAIIWSGKYPTVNLWKEGKHYGGYIHKLIAQAFIPNPHNKPKVNHKNGVKTDFRLRNLEWATKSEDVLHAFSTGLSIPTKGSRHGRARLTTQQVTRIRSAYATGKFTQVVLAKKYSVGQTTIADIVLRKIWKHV
jgi:hypothetical protein